MHITSVNKLRRINTHNYASSDPNKGIFVLLSKHSFLMHVIIMPVQSLLLFICTCTSINPHDCLMSKRLIIIMCVYKETYSYLMIIFAAR